METFVPENVNDLWEDHVNRLQRESLTRQIDAARREIRRVAETVGPGEELDRLRTGQNELIAARKELESQRGGAGS